MLCPSLPKWVGLPCVAGLIALTAASAQPRIDYQPQVGQQGKDVIWIPTPDVVVNRMLDMAQVTPTDYVIDLGSGDGRTVIAAAKRGAKAHGIEYEQAMVDLSIPQRRQSWCERQGDFHPGRPVRD